MRSATTRLYLYFLNSFEIQSRILIQNVLSHDFTHLPCDHESHSSFEGNLIPKYKARRSVRPNCGTTYLNLYFLKYFEIQSRFSIQNVFRHDLKHLPCGLVSHSSYKSSRLPEYNAKRSTFDAITRPIGALNPLPNATRSNLFDSIVQQHVGLSCATTHLNMYFLKSFENQS
ncbi:uncharacterized protein G2W53_033534 [Senna tora]|uniref:Uncharacterized protein n=1 Tax=Senna tora TaxID=362788 RepID=A0A834SXP5_9FABA|nr:uncharacterized protein G2W53_033534 [Senna tora]